MKIETKTGIVVLLDALGTRTASVEAAQIYLDCLETLQRDVQGTDTTLITYEGAQKKTNF
jgi:acid phosphatase family membrane protein YuiD